MVSSDNIDLMESTIASFSNYFKYVGEYGVSKNQDKFKLLVLFFLCDTLYNSTYIYKLTPILGTEMPESNDPVGMDISIDVSKKRFIDTVFNKVLSCITENSCCIIATVDNKCNKCLPEGVIDFQTYYLTNVIATNIDDGMAINTDKQVDGDDVQQEEDSSTPSTATILHGPNWYDFENDPNLPEDRTFSD